MILLSARAGEEARVEGVDAGADDYLTKPFSARELLARVGTNLAMARLRREAVETLREVNLTLEARVAERTRERDSIWRLSRDLMVVVRLDSTGLALNPAWTTVLGWEESELLDGNLLELVHPDDRAATKSAVASAGPGTGSRQLREPPAPSRRHISLDHVDGSAERRRRLRCRP